MLRSSRLRVCVTGGAGFIGSAVTRRLLEMGHHVIVLDDLSSGTRAPHPTSHLTFIKGSVIDRRAVSAAVSGADLILHMAGVVGMRLAYEKRNLSYAISVHGTRQILECAPAVPIVAMSSSAVYGDRHGTLMHEAETLDPQGVLRYDGGAPGYALGKLHLERIVSETAAYGFCVRPFNVVGRGQASKYGMVVPTFVTRALSGKNLVVYDDGLQTRCLSDIDSFVEALLKIIENPESWKTPSRVINLGSNKPTTILSLAQQVIIHSRSQSAIEFVPYNSAFPGRDDIRARVPDVRLLQSLAGPIGWACTEKIVRTLVRNHREPFFARAERKKPASAA